MTRIAAGPQQPTQQAPLSMGESTIAQRSSIHLSLRRLHNLREGLKIRARVVMTSCFHDDSIMNLLHPQSAFARVYLRIHHDPPTHTHCFVASPENLQEKLKRVMDENANLIREVDEQKARVKHLETEVETTKKETKKLEKS